MDRTLGPRTRKQCATGRHTKNSQGARSEPPSRSRSRRADDGVNGTPRARAANASRADQTPGPVRELKRPDRTITWRIENPMNRLAKNPGYGKYIHSSYVAVKGLRFNMVAFPFSPISASGQRQADKKILAVYLRAATSDPDRRRRFDVDFKLQIDKHNGTDRRRRSPKSGFELAHSEGYTPVGEYEDYHGYDELLSYKVLFDPTKGYFVKNAITLRAEITVLESVAGDTDGPAVPAEENPPNAGAEENPPNGGPDENEQYEDDDIKIVYAKKLSLPEMKAEPVAQEPVEASEQELEVPVENDPQSDDDDDCVFIGVTQRESRPSVGVSSTAAPTPPTPCVKTEASEASTSTSSSILSMPDVTAEGRNLITPLDFGGMPIIVPPFEDVNDVLAPVEDLREIDADHQLANGHPKAVEKPRTAAVSAELAAATARQAHLHVNAPGPSEPAANEDFFDEFVRTRTDVATRERYNVSQLAGETQRDFLKKEKLHNAFVPFVLSKLNEKNPGGTTAFIKMLRGTQRVEDYAQHAVDTSPSMKDYVTAKGLESEMRHYARI